MKSKTMDLPLNVERRRHISESDCSDCTSTSNSEVVHSYIKDAQCLIEIRKMMEESGDELLIKNTWEFTDDWLLRYIRSRGYNVETAFERLQNHMYVRRVKNPEIFARLYPSAVYHAIETGMAGILKQRDDKGRHILYFRVGLWDPEDIPVDDMLLQLMIYGWEMLSFQETQLQGIVVILDAKGFSVKHARTGTPMNIQKYADLILRASPFKCKGGHILFAPRMFNITLSVVKMFLPQKLRKRIHAHGSSTSGLHEFVSPDILPKWLGGNLSDEEAIDSDIIDALYTKEKEDYYRSFCN